MTSPPARSVRGLVPGGPVHATLAVPGSKSLAQRLLVAGALAGGTTRIVGLDRCGDVAATETALERLGADLARPAPRAVSVTGRPPGPGRGLGSRGATVDLGESGTGARLVTAAVALCGAPGRPVVVGGSGTLARRSSPALFAALERAGARIERLGGPGWQGWPVRVHPIGPPPEVRLERPESSQEASALVLALAAWPGEAVLRIVGRVPSSPYLEMTLSVAERFGVELERSGDWSSGGALVIRGPLSAPAEPLAVEPDASSAAVALAAACLSGGELRVPGLAPGSLQKDVRIARHLAAFGCHARFDAEGLAAGGLPERGATLDLSGEPDLAPVLAAVAASVALRCGAASRLEGLETLAGKESSRVETLAAGLTALGLDARAGAGTLEIGPGRAPSGSELWLDPRGDHRMAFAFALLGLLRGGVHVVDAGCVEKSWPGFWDDLAAAGFASV